MISETSVFPLPEVELEKLQIVEQTIVPDQTKFLTKAVGFLRRHPWATVAVVAAGGVVWSLIQKKRKSAAVVSLEAGLD